MPEDAKVILVADDDPFMRRLIEIVLRKGNPKLQILQAANGVEALALVQHQRPDVAIVDVVMPKMNGEELSRRLKELYPGLPILIVTGVDNPESRRRLMEEIKVNQYLSKAMDMRGFYGEVVKLFDLNRPKGL